MNPGDYDLRRKWRLLDNASRAYSRPCPSREAVRPEIQLLTVDLSGSYSDNRRHTQYLHGDKNSEHRGHATYTIRWLERTRETRRLTSLLGQGNNFWLVAMISVVTVRVNLAAFISM